jgi:hypothetical protein
MNFNKALLSSTLLIVSILKPRRNDSNPGRLRSRLSGAALLLVLTFTVLGGGISDVYAQTTYYVRSGATGANNGTDWNNAYVSLPAALVRGATYYIADGTYDGYSFNTSVSGTQVITIKKATIADHGTNSGWRDSYGDGQAVFGALNFGTSYWVFDGAIRNEANWFDGGSYGFVVTRSNATNAKLFNTGGNSNITIRNTHGYFPSVCYTYECHRTSWVYAIGGTNLLFEKNYFKNNSWFAGFLFHSIDGVVISHSIFENLYFKEWISANINGGNYARNVRVHNNIVRNVAGTGAIVGANLENWEIFNNVLYSPDSSYTLTDGIFTTLTGWNQSWTNMRIYGNTFSQLHGAKRIGSDGGSGNESRNNIFHGFAPQFTRSMTASHNLVNTGDLFVSLKNENFRLANSTTAGYTLSKPYNSDFDGNIRGANGTWDIGAFEFNNLLSPPINLVIRE